MRRFSLLFKIIIIYLLSNLLVFIPVNRYIYKNLDSFYTIFQDNTRLFHYDTIPDLSMRGHWINSKYLDNKKNIIMVGDSTVEDFYVDYEDSIASLLDSMLFPSQDSQVFNFGASGTKSVYVMERIKKAVSFEPDLIIWQMGAGSFTEIDWLFPPRPSSYDISLGGSIFNAYKNIYKINNENGYFISRELMGHLVPLSKYKSFYTEYLKGKKSKSMGVPLPYPNDSHLKLGLGDVEIKEQFYGIAFNKDTRYFEVLGVVSDYVKSHGIDLMIYIAPINQSVMAEKYEGAYYEKLYDTIRSQTQAHDIPILNIYNLVPDELFIDGGHLKEEGDLLVAKALYDFVLLNFPDLVID